MGTWDKGLELEQVISKLKEELSRAEGAEYTYLAVLLTQSLNGCRVGEAFSAVQDFAKTGQRELRVKVEKRKDGAERLIIIPPEVQRAKIDLNVKLANVKMYAIRKLKINTHSLRYAWITYQVKNNVNPGMIAAITGHKNLNMLMHYIQKKQGEEYLRRQLRMTQGVS
jgi:integrase